MRKNSNTYQISKEMFLTWGFTLFQWIRGWSGGAKMSCTLQYWGVQLILAYSWARSAILEAGKGRGVMFLFLYFFCFFTFIPVPLSSLSISFISSTISSISFLPFSGRRHKMTHKGWRVVKPQHNKKSVDKGFKIYFTLALKQLIKKHNMNRVTNGMGIPEFGIKCEKH